LIEWYLTPTSAVFQVYRGSNIFFLCVCLLRSTVYFKYMW